MDDSDLYKIATYLEENCNWEIEEMEIHLLNPNSNNSIGINRFCVTFGNTMTSLKITILDCLSWHSIGN